MKLALFDIDGTLLDSCSIDAACYLSAIEPLVGAVDDDWSRYHDISDEGVLSELLGRALTNDERTHVQRKLVDELAQHVIEPIRGAREFVAAIDTHHDWRGALATGAWECSARQKLRAAGIDVNWPLASSDDSPNRVAIARIAIARAVETYGDFDDVVFFGDSPWDRVTAETLGIGFVHVVDFADPGARFATMRAACTGASSSAIASSVSSTSGR